MSDVLTMILAGGKGGALRVLTYERAKTALPFAGKYRVIDFPLSNCVNSDIYNVGILAQYLPRSLGDHIRTGKPWDLDRLNGGVRLLQPYYRRQSNNWYRGTADALLQNTSFIDRFKQLNYVLVISGDQVYTMDYRPLVEFHKENNSDLTIAVKEVDPSQSQKFGMVTLDGDTVTDFQEKPKKTQANHASMGIYLFSKDYLKEQLDRLENEEKYCIVRNILMEQIGNANILAYKYDGYWQDVGDICSYYETNMELLSPDTQLHLYNENWVIRTRSEERAPVKFDADATIDTSLISNGCIIEGEVKHSILSPGVHVEKGAVVKDSIIMTDTVIKSGTTVNTSILDKRIVVGKNCRIGVGENIPNKNDAALRHGITIIGKGTKIPDNCHIGKNCEIGVGFTESDFSQTIDSGESLM